jgi:hypothetical protein
MNDQAVSANLQAAAKQIEALFPGRAFCLFVLEAEGGQRSHYVSNAERGPVIDAMRAIIAKGDPLPPKPRSN